jgi:hypothetical protein
MMDATKRPPSPKGVRAELVGGAFNLWHLGYPVALPDLIHRWQTPAPSSAAAPGG